MNTCPKCLRNKVRVEEAMIGYPKYHVAGSRQEYCGYCDEPPISELYVGVRAITLYLNDPLVEIKINGKLIPAAPINLHSLYNRMLFAWRILVGKTDMLILPKDTLDEIYINNL